MLRIASKIRTTNFVGQSFRQYGIVRYGHARSLSSTSTGTLDEEGKKPVSEAPAAAKGSISTRFMVTAEVIASKLFPAGFGWQAGSIVAGDMGMKATDASFALMTGLGDFTGVLLGHTIFYGLKSFVVKDISIGQEVVIERHAYFT